MNIRCHATRTDLADAFDAVRLVDPLSSAAHVTAFQHQVDWRRVTAQHGVDIARHQLNRCVALGEQIERAHDTYKTYM